MHLGPCLLHGGRKLQGACPKLACFCCVTVAGFSSAVDTGDGGLVGKDADHIGASLDLLVEAFERVRGVDFRPVVGRKTLVGQGVVLGATHQFSQLGVAWLERLDQPGPVLLAAMALSQRVSSDCCQTGSRG